MDEGGGVEAEKGGDAGGEVAEGSGARSWVAGDSGLGWRSGWRSLGAWFDGGSGRVGREEAVLRRMRSMMARRARIILVGLGGVEGHAISAVPEMLSV